MLRRLLCTFPLWLDFFIYLLLVDFHQPPWDVGEVGTTLSLENSSQCIIDSSQFSALCVMCACEKVRKGGTSRGK